MSRKVKIKVDFSKAKKRGYLIGPPTVYNPDAEKLILTAFKTVGVKLSKIRTTYVEDMAGRDADMPHKLMLALLITETKQGLGWYLPKLSGEYTFVFKD